MKLIERDSNPERVFCVKKKLPVASFLTKWYADGYRNALAFGSASEKYAKRIVPDDPPEKANDLDDYLDCSVFFDIFCYNVELYYKLCYNYFKHFLIWQKNQKIGDILIW